MCDWSRESRLPGWSTSAHARINNGDPERLATWAKFAATPPNQRCLSDARPFVRRRYGGGGNDGIGHDSLDHRMLPVVFRDANAAKGGCLHLKIASN